MDETAGVQEKAFDLVLGGHSKRIARAVEIVKREMDQAYGSGSQLILPSAPSKEVHVSTVADLHKLVAKDSIDAIITFPPAHCGYLPVFADLARFAAHALKNTGVLVLMASSQFLPRVIVALEHPGLNWVGEWDYRFDDPPGKGGEPHWLRQRRRPLLVYGKPGYRLGGGFDVIQLPPADQHPPANRWDQRLELGMKLVFARFALPGQTVCDPATVNRSATALAALERGCSFVGAFDDAGAVRAVRAAMDRWTNGGESRAP